MTNFIGRQEKKVETSTWQGWYATCYHLKRHASTPVVAKKEGKLGPNAQLWLKPNLASRQVEFQSVSHAIEAPNPSYSYLVPWLLTNCELSIHRLVSLTQTHSVDMCR